jgi:hypothetical protein
MSYSYDRTAARLDLERPAQMTQYRVWVDGRWTAEQISDDGEYTKVASGRLQAGSWQEMAERLRTKVRAKRLPPPPAFLQEDWFVRGSGASAYMICNVG